MKSIPLILLATLLPLPALASHRPPPEGAVQVVNTSGATVTVSVTGGAPTTLGNGRTATLYGPVGETWLKATYVQFGATRTLETERVHLSRNHRQVVVLEPEDQARVQVVNTSGLAGELRIDGRSFGLFKPGQRRVLTLETGPAALAFVADGRLVDETRLELRAYVEPTWTVEPLPYGDLVVHNPLPIPIELVCPKGLVRTVQPYGTTTYDEVRAGPFSLTARRVTDEPIDRVSVDVQAGRAVTWTVDPPSQGFLVVESEHWTNARVYVDGRLVRTLPPGAEVRLTLDVGVHEIAVRDDMARPVYARRVEVEPYDVAAIEFGSARHVLADTRDDRDDHHDRHDDDDPWRDDHDDHSGHSHGRGGGCSMPE